MKSINKQIWKPLCLLLGISMFVHVGLLEAKTKYRHSFNTTDEKDGISVTTSVGPSPEEQKKEEEKEQEKETSDSSESESQSQSKEDEAAKREEAYQKLKNTLEKQREMLNNFKPLIKPRSYDDMMQVNQWAPDLKLNRLPELREAIVPGRAPNIRLIPYLLKSFAHPAYKAQFNGVTYYIAVNCDNTYGFDDCSTIPHNQFKTRHVYVRFIQSSDPKFNLVPGMHVGDTYLNIKHLFDEDTKIHGDGECLETRSQDWLACFNAKKMVVNKQRLEMMPANDSKLSRFIKISGRGY